MALTSLRYNMTLFVQSMYCDFKGGVGDIFWLIWIRHKNKFLEQVPQWSQRQTKSTILDIVIKVKRNMNFFIKET